MPNPYRYALAYQKRTYTTAQLALQDGLVQLNKEKDLHQISIKELCGRAHVARSTFYTYYNVINEVLEDVENTLISDMRKLNQGFERKVDLKEEDLMFFQDILAYVKQKQDIFKLFLIERPNMQFINKWKSEIKYIMWERTFSQKDVRNSAFILEMVAAQVVAAFTFWINYPEQVDLSGVTKVVLATLYTVEKSKEFV